ncbi:carboxylesterase family protein [Streptomyces boncukensis]|uniref:Carboxylic ester hydrolase n=1 Tax=Streptomyces boncukensis TaxID=2711219 RepID=A0A6G4WW95_9ACTN|nr:carboxylesterase family protein [Streptomyces boncukensis]NGO69556.1 carboxylesterase family protein [Streptomyces boncukensis]
MATTSSTREPRPAVATAPGRLRGRAAGPDGAVAAFLGVPYAASPTGALRFAPPRPHPGWSGVRDAAEPGPSAPQAASRLEAVMGARTPDWDEEGCLTLNVWTPRAALGPRPARPRAVLLWFHGGGFTSGSGGWDWYDGARLAARGDMVVVTANYRLGPLGYLHLPQIGADNLGTRDQTAALAWVHRTIAEFGGDPARITVGGQSAGAFSAVALSVDPATSAMVHRTVAQSSPAGLDPQEPAEAARAADRFLHLLGLPGREQGQDRDQDRELGRRLRAVPAAELLDAYAALSAECSRPGRILPPMCPVLGGAGFPVRPAAALRDGAMEGRPVLAGTTADEMTAFGSRGEALAADTARVFADGTTEIVRQTAARGTAAFRYVFERRPRPDPAGLGACHCAELPFLFGTFDAYPGAPMLGAVDEADRSLGRALAGAVADFVNGGSPWPSYGGGHPHVECFGRSAGEG